MIAKRSQYRPRLKGKLPRKITDTGNLQKVIDYLGDKSNPNHEGVRLGPLVLWQIPDSASYLSKIEADAGAYRTHLGEHPQKGQPWGGEVAEHLTYNPPPGINLTPAEQTLIAVSILEKCCPHSQAVYCWHEVINPVPGKPEVDLHILAANFDERGGLRISRLRQGYRDYRHILREAGEAAIAKVNSARALLKIPSIPTVRTWIAKKRREQGLPSVAEVILDVLGTVTDDKIEIVAALEERGWKLRVSQKHISVVPPNKKESYRFEWQVLFTLISEAAESRDNLTRVPNKSLGSTASAPEHEETAKDITLD